MPWRRTMSEEMGRNTLIFLLVILFCILGFVAGWIHAQFHYGNLLCQELGYSGAKMTDNITQDYWGGIVCFNEDTESPAGQLTGKE